MKRMENERISSLLPLHFLLGALENKNFRFIVFVNFKKLSKLRHFSLETKKYGSSTRLNLEITNDYWIPRLIDCPRGENDT